jgi:tetratricopeptide (TPR) repeat protein
MISMSDSVKHATGAAVFAVAAISLLISAGCASAPATAPPVRLDFPAPDTGPGRPDLSNADKDHIDKGWKALQNGDAVSARAMASQAGANPATQLLELQALTAAESEYAAAWLTLSVAAENADDEKVALDAASRGAELWSVKRWREREQRLHQRYVGDRVDSARELYETEDPEAALEAIQPALELDPDNRDAVLMKARALIALDQPDRAEVALSGLPRDPEIVRLSGSIAEARGDLSAAMRIYSSLPDDPDAMLLAVAIAESQDDWLTAAASR